MRKNTLILILSCLLLCIGSIGCQGKTDSTTSVPASVTTTETSVVESTSAIPENGYLVRLSINPDVFFVVAENGEVLGMVAENEDAQDVINNFEASDKNIATILNEWTDRCNQMGFNTRKMEMAIIDADESETAVMAQLYTDLRTNHRAVGYAEINAQDELPEFPICDHCGDIFYSDSEVCPGCGESVVPEAFYCFCGARMRADQDLCPVCHLYNLSGEYEEGWGSNGKEFLYCFCGEKVDNRSGHCETCHLNNFTGEYDKGWGPQEDVLCVCGQSLISDNGLCPICHLNNITGVYKDGWGPSEEDPELHCIECDSTNVTYGPYVCKNCGGTKLSICFQCGGSGTDYVTAADDPDGSSGWYETCSNCKGQGQWPCQACANHEPEYGYTCNDCGREWSVD